MNAKGTRRPRGRAGRGPKIRGGGGGGKKNSGCLLLLLAIGNTSAALAAATWAVTQHLG